VSLNFSKQIESKEEELELLKWLKEVTSHFQNATFVLPLVSSGSQPDGDSRGPKHAGELIIL
jgi:hypothetical protein